MAFDITGITAQLGENHSVVEITKSYNARGDATVTKTNYSIFGIIQIMDGSEDECKEGLLTGQDIICFYDDQQTHLSKLTTGNQILYGSKYYVIKNAIVNQGHVEVHAKKI
jgi:hypothetical protein